MGYSFKRAKAVVQGKVLYGIYDPDGTLVFSHKSFFVAVQYADTLQKQNPGVNYIMKLVDTSEN